MQKNTENKQSPNAQQNSACNHSIIPDSTLESELDRILDSRSYYTKEQAEAIDLQYRSQLQDFDHKTFVLDDDPTGVQTVHGVSVYTDWEPDSIQAAFNDKHNLVYILTNSRAFQRQETAKVHQLIAERISAAAKDAGQNYLIISRSDSTLRGHYPLETEVLKNTLEAMEPNRFDGELIVPFFPEGGRYTINNIHYVKEGAQLVPAGETEFARDLTFAYNASHLGEWCEEKTGGLYKADDMIYINLDDIRNERLDKIVMALKMALGFNKIIINAVEYTDLKIVSIALMMAMAQGKHFMFRTAAALPKILGGIPDRPLLTKPELLPVTSKNGGLILIGSHVNKTSNQLDALRKSKGPYTFLEFNQHRVLETGGLENETEKIRKMAEQAISSGKTAVIYTRRERFELDSDDKEAQLRISVLISDALSAIVTNITVRPAFLITKGGITSSDVGTKSLQVKRATVMGQIKPGIPVWMTGSESKFPDLALIIFPGNVGEIETLREIADMLS